MNNNHFVLFSNIKGGVGKSSLCTLFAHYLKSKGKDVAVVDADIQRTIKRMRQRDLDKTPGVKVPWEAISVFDYDPRGDVTKILPVLKKQDGWILVDCPGNMEAERLTPLFEAADYVVVPLTYEETDVDATINLFVPVFKDINPTAELIFIPNRITERNQKGIDDIKMARLRTTEKLLGLGKVTARIKESVVFQPHRYNTLQSLDNYQSKAVEYAFDKVRLLIEND